MASAAVASAGMTFVAAEAWICAVASQLSGSVLRVMYGRPSEATAAAEELATAAAVAVPRDGRGSLVLTAISYVYSATRTSMLPAEEEEALYSRSVSMALVASSIAEVAVSDAPSART